MKKIFCDWGTSNLRAYLLEDGHVINEFSSELGLIKARLMGFEKVLELVCDELGIQSDVEIILSGMIGSKQGWFEAPYVSTPVSVEAMAGNAIKPIPHIKIFGGVSHLDESSNYDVMRGEEVQVFGVLEQVPEAKVICLPGSHSKWVKIEDGKIKSFATWMTGDLFKALSENSIFTTQIQSKEFNRETFIQGVEFAREQNELGTSLFKLRTEDLFGRTDRENFHSYLSGFLIGSEIREALGTTKEVGLCGSDSLMRSYELALEVFAINTSKFCAADATIKGIEKICGVSNE
jgi:2-dehydro-3-deoxygalactonokinase